ncbi:hypothetical protein ASD11_14100 [Aeromicrobium sp. Root495]|nr:hypothetical protein ASD11_14100 [Aeromicrobium sp. Root495]
MKRLRSDGVDLAMIDGSGGAQAHMVEFDYLVVTSDHEGLPNVIMEGLAAGATVVTRHLEGAVMFSELLQPAAADRYLVMLAPEEPRPELALADLLEDAGAGRHHSDETAREVFSPSLANSELLENLRPFRFPAQSKDGH